MVGCAAMIAYHVSGKAVRDTLFLTSFPITQLPVMVMVAAGFSVVSVIASSRAMMRFSPSKLVPVSFAISGVLSLLVWGLQGQFPRAAAVIMYLLIVGLGSLLTSGFWSIVNERYDPRSAKKLVGRIAGAGTLGGIAGGAMAERVAAMFSVSSVLPLLAFYHILCALVMTGSRKSDPKEAPFKPESKENLISGWQILTKAPYLRTLAILVLLGTVSAAMVDYVFKAQAVQFYGKGDNLLRFFAIFYGGAGVLTFVVQMLLAGASLDKLGLSRTVGTLPLAVSAGGLGALVAPGLVSATIARALEAVSRGSLFRSGYELFYTPIPKREKRAAKPIVDVGFDRLGDAIGSGFVTVLLALSPHLAQPAILTGAILVALIGVFMASRLQGAYIDALEHGLKQHGESMDLPDHSDSVMLSGIFESIVIPPPSLATQPPPISSIGPPTDSGLSSPSIAPAVLPETKPAIAVPPQTDPVIQAIIEFRCGDGARIVQAMEKLQPIPAYAVPHLIPLLAWDLVYPEVVRHLRKVADVHVGQLVDSMLDRSVDFTIRRRVPRVLSGAASQRAVNGLLTALMDRRFEVRYQCGRALNSLLRKHKELRVSQERVFEAIRREVTVSRAVWESHRLLDQAEERENEPEPLVDEFLRDRTSRSLQHVFTLLALVLPSDPLRIAFHGLHAEDGHLRGTALEYLESILPPDIRERLWPLLEKDSSKPPLPKGRSRDELLAELLQSNQSIQVNLEELRRRAGKDPTVS
jgi:hypothetical protein